MTFLAAPKSPASFFKWCILNANSDKIPFQKNYSHYFSNIDSHYLWRSYDRRLADIVPLARPGIRALEVGCGIGSDLHWLALCGADATGIDVKSEWISAAKALTHTVGQHFGNVSIDIRRVNLLNMNNAQFDLIYMKDTFHHLEPREQVVRKLAELLAPGGRIVVVEPNALNPAIQLQMFRIRKFKTIIAKIDSATGESFLYGNERLLTGRSLCKLFSRVNVQGSSRVFRLIPTSLSATVASSIGSILEDIGIDRVLHPAAIHCVYTGTKMA